MLALVTTSIVSAYATMGIYASGKPGNAAKRTLLSQKTLIKPGTFTLKSGYAFRGGQLLTSQNPAYVNLNTVATYKIGGTVYSVPLKKQMLLNGKVTFSNLNTSR